MDVCFFKISRFFVSGLRPIALPWILDLGPFEIQNLFLIKIETNFEYFFGAKNVASKVLKNNNWISINMDLGLFKIYLDLALIKIKDAIR